MANSDRVIKEFTKKIAEDKRDAEVAKAFAHFPHGQWRGRDVQFDEELRDGQNSGPGKDDMATEWEIVDAVHSIEARLPQYSDDSRLKRAAASYRKRQQELDEIERRLAHHVRSYHRTLATIKANRHECITRVEEARQRYEKHLAAARIANGATTVLEPSLEEQVEQAKREYESLRAQSEQVK